MGTNPRLGTQEPRVVTIPLVYSESLRVRGDGLEEVILCLRSCLGVALEKETRETHFEDVRGAGLKAYGARAPRKKSWDEGTHPPTSMPLKLAF